MKLRPHETDRALAQPDGAFKVYLIHGPDHGQVRERADALSRALVRDPDDPFIVTRLTDDDIKAVPTALADALAALSLTGEDRLVRLRLSGDSAPVGKLITNIENGDLPCEPTLVIETGDLKKNAKIRRAAENGKKSLTVPCYRDTPRDLIKLAEEMLRAENLELEPDARTILAPCLEGDRAMARNEIEKLILYKGLADQRGGVPDRITRDDIAAVAAIGSNVIMDQILNLALEGHPHAADAAYAKALSAGLNPVSFLRALQNRLAQFDIFHFDGRDANALTQASVPQFGPPADTFRRAARLWTGRRLDQARRRAFDTERAIKRSAAPAEAIAGDLILRLSHAASSIRK